MSNMFLSRQTIKPQRIGPRIDRDPGKIPVPVKIGRFAGIPVPVKIVKFTGIPTGILISNFWKIQLNFLEFFNIIYTIFGFYKILFYKIFSPELK